MGGTGEQPRWLVWGVPSALIVFGAVGAPQIGSRPLLFLGAASYSIYLVQILTIPAFYKVVIAAAGPDLPVDALVVGATVATLIVGTLLHVAFERPVLALLRGRRLAPTVRYRPEAEALEGR